MLQVISTTLMSATAGRGAPREVPWSSGTETPSAKAPPHATDCHHHIYDPRFPVLPTAVVRPMPATVADYRLLQKRLGTTRNVVVQPSAYGVDNRCLLDALHQFGPAQARGVAVVNEKVTESELKELHEAGVRGIRFNVVQPAVVTLDMAEPLARRIEPFGWHIQVYAKSEQIAAVATMWNHLPCPVVFDHFGRTVTLGREDPAYTVIAKLMQSGKGWVKLSGAYLEDEVGAPAYAKTVPIAKAYLAEAPERCVWGSDWPHPSVNVNPDDAVLFDLLAKWVPDVRLRERVLVGNPASLYGFA
jgi:D-galactarolactone isomerase